MNQSKSKKTKSKRKPISSGNHVSSFGLSILISLFVGAVILFLMLAVASLILLKVTDPDKYMSAAVILTAIFTALSQGIAVSKKCGQKKFPAALCSGFVMCTILYFISIFFDHASTDSTVSFKIAILAILLLVPMLGVKMSSGEKRRRR